MSYTIETLWHLPDDTPIGDWIPKTFNIDEPHWEIWISIQRLSSEVTKTFVREGLAAGWIWE